MSTYVVGDIQGCLSSLLELLEHINFDISQDQLWLTGDLVNRGPQSLETLRYVKSLGKSVISVLGNHDLHFLAVVSGFGAKHKLSDIDEILQAPDLMELVHWLRGLPLIYHDPNKNFTLVHAGIPPQWSLTQTLQEAHAVEAALRSDDYLTLLENLYGDSPEAWSESLKHYDRLRYIINAFTRMRYCDAEGTLEFKHKTNKPNPKADFSAWYSFESRLTKANPILFGHWSSLGAKTLGNIYSLDSGCVWGGQLTALKIEPKLEWLQVECPEYCPID